MPVIDRGVQKCAKCGKKFEWEYFETIRNYAGQSRYQVETLPDSKLLVRKRPGSQKAIAYWKNCPYCDFDNEISVR